jgi:hypothetical protein
MLAALTLLVGVVSGQVAIYRSVGSHPGPLAVGDGGLNVFFGGTASFPAPLPDNVGVGDVIQYDSDANGTPDALAFITGRDVTGADFSVQSETGGPPTSASGAAWQVFRAYPSLMNAVNTNMAFGALGGSANPSIAAALQGFDQFSGGKDLVDAGQQWNVACYDDAPDTAPVYVGAPWVTDATHNVLIFAPATAAQVGTTQRHRGTWGAGYRRTATLQVADRDVWIDGLAIQQSAALDMAGINRTLMVHTGHKGSDIRISNSYVEQARVATGVNSHALFVADDDRPWGTLTTHVWVWNTIAVNQSSTGTSGTQGNGAIVNDTSDSLAIANCTAVAMNGASALLSMNDSGVVADNLAVNTIAVTGGSLAVALFLFAPGFRSDHVASNDGTASSNTVPVDSGINFPNTVFAFAGVGDYHLDSSDTGARGRGVSVYASYPAFPSFIDDIDGQPRLPDPFDLGADQLFTPRSPTAVTTYAAFALPTSVRLGGSASPNGSPTTAWFRYAPGVVAACDDTFGSRAPADGGFSVGEVGVQLLGFSLFVDGLTPNTMYSYCTVAGNVAGHGYGTVETFYTMPAAGGGTAIDVGSGGGGTAGAGGGSGATGGGASGGSRTYFVGCGCGQSGVALILLLLPLSLRRAFTFRRETRGRRKR